MVCRPDLFLSLGPKRVWLRNGQQSFNLLPGLWGTSGINRAKHLGPCLSGHGHRALSKWTLSPYAALLTCAWASRQEEFSHSVCPWSFLAICNYLSPIVHFCTCHKCVSVYSGPLEELFAQNEKSVTVYSTSCHSKPVCCYNEKMAQMGCPEWTRHHLRRIWKRQIWDSVAFQSDLTLYSCLFDFFAFIVLFNSTGINSEKPPRKKCSHLPVKWTIEVQQKCLCLLL